MGAGYWPLGRRPEGSGHRPTGVADGQRAEDEMAQMPVLDVVAVTIAAPDPRELAAFYERMLGWTIVASEPARPGFPPQDGWAQLRPPEGRGGPTLNFEYEEHYAAPTWPSAPGRQHITAHLDIVVADLDESVAWALATGATLAEYQPQDLVRVLLDPAGHPFCLFLSAAPAGS